MVESVNGTPNFSAARAARISPSACCMPVRPVGAMRHRHRHRPGPTIVRASAAVLHVDRHALAQLDLLEVALVGAVGALGPGAGVGVVVEHARHALLREHAQVFDVGDHGHESLLGVTVMVTGVRAWPRVAGILSVLRR